MNQDTIGGYWPLYEDGTPVRIGDTVEGTIVPMEVKGVEVYAAATTVIGDCDHLHLSPGERVERVGDTTECAPCLCGDPDGGVETTHVPRDEPNWHLVIDGVRYGVSNHARRAIAEALGLTTGRQTLPSGITWPEVDGEPVMPGDVLWDLDGNRLTVGYATVTADQSGTRHITFVYGDSGEFIFHSTEALTRTEPEPAPGHDSWERLAEDARKSFVDYWSCDGIECIDCPAMVDGKAPYERYRTSDCAGGGGAMDADIAARVRALAGVGDE